MKDMRMMLDVDRTNAILQAEIGISTMLQAEVKLIKVASYTGFSGLGIQMPGILQFCHLPAV